MVTNRKEVKDWIEIRDMVGPLYQYDDFWEQSILLFHNRLKEKFFNPIQKLIDQRILKGEGFSIVTVQCALIESFAAFREGKIYKSTRFGYSRSKEMFTSLLLSASIFEDNFWKLDENGGKIKNSPFNADDFYTGVRCKLMHEARTKGIWHITATELRKNVRTEKKFLVQKNGNINILRTVLHYRLLDYLEYYENELRDVSEIGCQLRKNFARKLDDLYDIPPDDAYDWWIVHGEG